MNDNELDMLISVAIGDAPPAPEELRHNVMERVRELENEPKTIRIFSRRRIYTFASTAVSLALVAVVAVFIFSDRRAKDNAAPAAGAAQFSLKSAVEPETETSMFDISEESEADMDTVPMEEDDTVFGETADKSIENGGLAADLPQIGMDGGTGQYAQVELPQPTAAMRTVLLVEGSLPELMATLEYSVQDDGSYLYEDVDDEIVQELVDNGATWMIAAVSAGEGTAVVWRMSEMGQPVRNR